MNTSICQSTQLMGEHSEASEKARVRVRKEKGEEGGGDLGNSFLPERQVQQ